MSRIDRLGKIRAPLGFAIVAAVASMLPACGVSAPSSIDAAGTGADGGSGVDIPATPIEAAPDPGEPPELRPPVDLEVHGMKESRVNQVATTTVADLEEWWAEEYPRVFGEDYRPLTGGLHAYDSNSDAGDIPCLGPGVSVDEFLYNAFYCFDDDAVAWDQEFLLPWFAESHGEFAVSIVLAHEWGHVIQADERSGFQDEPIVMDLQADCYAGAWARHAQDTDRPYFDVDAAALDTALAALLELRDAPGMLATDRDAHGSGFDRVGAFQDGYLNSASSCAEYSIEVIDSYLFEFFDTEDHHSGGDMPLEEIKRAAIESLDAYWSDVYPTLSDGDPWPGLEGLEFSESSPPMCGGERVSGYRLFLCWPDRYVGFSTEAAGAAYDDGLDGPGIGGDFAVAALLATQYGLGVQLALGDDVRADPVLGTLRGDCFAGAWGADLIETSTGSVPEEWVLRLSPGDLDEGIGALLLFRTESDLERQGPGFDRVTAFRTGVIEGPAVCVTYDPDAGT